MSPTFFTTDGGDVILRAGSESSSRHDFCVHKLILSLASPVFKDMFTFPQPPDQTSDGEDQLPVVDVTETPKILDMVLRFIYPGAKPPAVVKQKTLSALLVATEKYNITSIHPALREKLKTFLPTRSLWVYIIARRFGFLGIAREAAEVSGAQSLTSLDNREDLQYISSVDLFRFVEFVQTRERRGLAIIEDILLVRDVVKPHCSHCDEEARDYYFYLEKSVKDVFAADPCLGSKDLIGILDKAPDPPLACDPPVTNAWWLREISADTVFECLLRPMTIRGRLSDIVEQLDKCNAELLDELFGEDFESE